jgi:hypothetical protein
MGGQYRLQQRQLLRSHSIGVRFAGGRNALTYWFKLMANIYIYQIYYDDRSKAALDPGFIALDNSSNERPDWREYHPIRKYLLEHKLESDSYYGFLSPQFKNKTNLTSGEVKRFVRENDGVDVAIFCPFFDQSAFFLNVFEQGESHHAGLMQASERFAKVVGIDVDFKTLVNDSADTIFCNYFVAKSTFWAKWLRIAEQLYDLCESPSTEVSRLVAPTAHHDTKDIELKVFLMERLATLLLSTSGCYKTAVYDPTNIPPSAFQSRSTHLAIFCDALKIAHKRLNNRRYIDEYLVLRNQVPGPAKIVTIKVKIKLLIKYSLRLVKNILPLPGHVDNVR